MNRALAARANLANQFVAVAALTVGALHAPAARGQALDISHCAGVVHISAQTQGTTPQWLHPPDANQGARLTPGASVWQLHCGNESTQLQQSGPRTAGRIEINRAIGPGAVATQNIGSSSNVERGSSKPLRLALPPNWRIVGKAWSGELQTIGAAWQLEMELGAGQIDCSQLRDSSIVLDAGSVQVGQAQGRLHVHVRGAGSVTVAQMQQTALRAELTGAGTIQLKGSAASAIVRARGVGTIEIEHVATEPQVQVSGAVTIDIGR